MELPLAVLAEIYHIAKGSISRKKMRLKEKSASPTPVSTSLWRGSKILTH